METVSTKNAVLNKEAIDRKLKRMAYEIAEQNNDERELIVAAINGNGELVAKKLIGEIKRIHSFVIEEVTVQLNKKNPLDVALNKNIPIENKVIILVDDVANTGKTMLYALKPFLAAAPKKIQTLVLVERSHKLFPVQTDYAGLSIATTLQEHIAVEREQGELTGAWLY